jgi:leader peptidase (prepilin peptidase)/N-methyltransferase
MEGIWITVFTLLGMAVASFLNVCIDRLPAGESLLFPTSHCASCHHRLAIKDLVPVFSYLWLRGRCRYCSAPIPRRLLWVEVGTGALFGYLYWHYGLSIELAVITFYCCLFITLMVIDLEHGLILNKIVYPAALVAIIISIFLPPSRLIYPSGVVPLPVSDFLPQLGIVQAAIGGGIGLGLFLLIVLIFKGGMGWGDVKMTALIGLVTGFPLIFVALFLAVILGGLVAGTLLLLKIRKRKEGIPFGPSLSLATIVTLLYGSNILNWYLGLL